MKLFDWLFKRNTIHVSIDGNKIVDINNMKISDVFKKLIAKDYRRLKNEIEEWDAIGDFTEPDDLEYWFGARDIKMTKEMWEDCLIPEYALIYELREKIQKE